MFMRTPCIIHNNDTINNINKNENNDDGNVVVGYFFS